MQKRIHPGTNLKEKLGEGYLWFGRILEKLLKPS